MDENVYSEICCSSCGAKMVTLKSTIITRCAFCNSQELVVQNITGKFEPDEIIPFKVTKEDFVQMYHYMVTKLKFVPKKYKNNSVINEVVGMYVPHYMYELYTELCAYDVYGLSSDNRWMEYKISEDALPVVDGSMKMTDVLMTSIEPFDYNELKPFQVGYLAGYQAERYDEEIPNLEDKAEKRVINRYLLGISQDTVGIDHGFFEVNFAKKDEPKYLLLPVWYANIECNGKNYQFMANGQTGKIAGKVPINKIKIALLAILAGIICTLLPAYGLLQDFIERYQYFVAKNDYGYFYVIAIIFIMVTGVFFEEIYRNNLSEHDSIRYRSHSNIPTKDFNIVSKRKVGHDTGKLKGYQTQVVIKRYRNTKYVDDVPYNWEVRPKLYGSDKWDAMK